MYKEQKQEQEGIETQEEFSQTHENADHQVHAQGVDTQDTAHNAPVEENYEKPDKNNNERFIIFALIAGVVIVSVLVGVGMTLFYPTQSGVAGSVGTSSVTTEQALNEEEELSDNGEVVIIYGGEEEPDEAGEEKSAEKSNENASATGFSTPNVAEKPAEVAHATSASPPVSPTNPSVHGATQRTTNTTLTTTKPQKAPVVASRTGALTAKVEPPVQSTGITAPVGHTDSTGFVKPNISPITKKPIPVANAKQKLYWVQVFSTSNRNKAYNIKGEFEKRGITTVVVTKTINSQLYYRLRIGPYYNKSEGDKFLQWVKKIDVYKDAYLTTNYI